MIETPLFIEIPLHDKAGLVVAYALIDERSLPVAEHFRWHRDRAGYVRRNLRNHPSRGEAFLHRVVLGLQPGDSWHVDHINHDKLDNRLANLRLVTHAQNMQNRSPIPGARARGVHKAGEKFEARAELDGVRHYLGTYETEGEAAAVASAFRAEHMPFSEDARRLVPA